MDFLRPLFCLPQLINGVLLLQPSPQKSESILNSKSDHANPLFKYLSTDSYLRVVFVFLFKKAEILKSPSPPKLGLRYLILSLKPTYLRFLSLTTLSHQTHSMTYWASFSGLCVYITFSVKSLFNHPTTLVTNPISIQGMHLKQYFERNL